MSKIEGLGEKSSAWLHEIDIHSLEEIRALGVVEVYRRLKARFPREITLNMLWGLESALTGIPWNKIPDEVKADLRAQVE
ncbi:MAG: TfoX/Sxy family DNA transformation protein [Anaerolineae bacterium]